MEPTSETTILPPERMVIDAAELRRLFDQAKGYDLSQAQFEQNKTDRIKALCQAAGQLPAGSAALAASGYSSATPLSELLSHLRVVMESRYEDVPKYPRQ